MEKIKRIFCCILFMGVLLVMTPVFIFSLFFGLFFGLFVKESEQEKAAQEWELHKLF